VEEAAEAIKNFAWHLMHCREAMGVIGNLLARLSTVVFKNKNYARYELMVWNES
jgi:hypothetical protein